MTSLPAQAPTIARSSLESVPQPRSSWADESTTLAAVSDLVERTRDELHAEWHRVMPAPAQGRDALDPDCILDMLDRVIDSGG